MRPVATTVVVFHLHKLHPYKLKPFTSTQSSTMADATDNMTIDPGDSSSRSLRRAGKRRLVEEGGCEEPEERLVLTFGWLNSN